MIDRLRKINHLEEWFGVIGLCYLLFLAGIAYVLIHVLIGMSGDLLRVERSTAPLPETFRVEEARSLLHVSSSLVSPLVSHVSSPSFVASSTSQESFLRILPTRTGFLNVRGAPFATGAIVGKVIPGETYSFESHQGEWYQIVLKNGSMGWVFGGYVEEIQ